MREQQLDVIPSSLPGGRSFDGREFPPVLACRTQAADLAAAERWVSAHRNQLDARVRTDGALIFRGFPVKSAEDLDSFVESFGYENFSYDESLSNAVRVNLTPRVFTANEAPPTATIRLHHEMAQTPIHPSRLFFFCERPAKRGGATALCRSDVLLEELASQRPDFVGDCEKKGLRYSNVMPPVDDASSGLGRSWRSTFGVEDRSHAERRMRRLGYEWEWLEGDCLRATTPVLPAVRSLPSGRKSFFNQLIAALAWQDRRNVGENAVVFGDGSAIEPGAAALAGEIAEQITVDVAWQTGDVALVDNYVVMHGRRSFEGPRRVLASLVAGEA